MIWEGQKIKQLSREQKVPLEKVAKHVKVSRRTVYDWIKGQIPKGSHLISLCNLFNVGPDYFFINNQHEFITVPVHRKRGKAIITEKTKEFSFTVAQKYQILFKNNLECNIVPVIRKTKGTKENAQVIAQKLRMYSGIPLDNIFPLKYQNTLSLLDNLGITVIINKFPEQIKSYAFYTKINNNRIVFINHSTNIIDLIFPMLHEAVHAVQDELNTDNIYSDDEEYYCDTVANYLQFSKDYTDMVYESILGIEQGTFINKLKFFGEKYYHSLYGICKRIELEKTQINFDYPSICRADSNFKKKFPTIGDLLFNTDDPVKFVNNLSILFPSYYKRLQQSINSITDRKLQELLFLESYFDALEIKKAIKDFNRG